MPVQIVHHKYMAAGIVRQTTSTMLTNPPFPFGAPFKATTVEVPLEVRTGVSSGEGNHKLLDLYDMAPSPVNVHELEKELFYYLKKEAQFLVNGFKYGFSLQHEGPRKATE